MHTYIHTYSYVHKFFHKMKSNSLTRLSTKWRRRRLHQNSCKDADHQTCAHPSLLQYRSLKLCCICRDKFVKIRKPSYGLITQPLTPHHPVRAKVGSLPKRNHQRVTSPVMGLSVILSRQQHWVAVQELHVNSCRNQPKPTILKGPCKFYIETHVIPAQTPNNMGSNAWAEYLQALLLSNSTLSFLVLVAAHMTHYQHFIRKISVAHACSEKQTLTAWLSEPLTLCRIIPSFFRKRTSMTTAAASVQTPYIIRIPSYNSYSRHT